ncbi:hypothetical protein GQ55_1G061500 [Panicum hallii var. hallii]|uniref:BZIP domain-containing protein n=1 Tax=Panicum hallii var. hallii TaxID=1504633 RepID=A0A2T7F2T8_9POAL|nr:hypothetical protein GQ55_1G061500 [Panicum hallii var. hallii]
MDADADELAADIICSLRGADLAGWTPPWCKPAPREGELIWPPVARGKRSRRRSPSAGPAASGKGRWGRGSPASPLDYSGGSGSGSGSGSGGSTSGGEDGGGFCSPGHRRAPATKVGSIGRPQLTFPTPPTRATGQRPRKKLRLPEVQQLVRSLTVENDSLREEMRALQRACKALSKENDKLETRLGQSDSPNEITSKDQKGKEHIDEQVAQSTQDSFVLPDLNLPPQDTADVSPVH